MAAEGGKIIPRFVGVDGGDDAGAGGSGQKRKDCLDVGSGLKEKDIE